MADTMASIMSGSRALARGLFRVVLYGYASLLVLACLLLRGTSTYAWATVPNLVDGTAYRPFVTRALVPAIVRTLVRATPALHAAVDARIARSLDAARPGFHPDRLLATLGWTPADAYLQAVAAGVMAVCFLLLPWVFRYLLTIFYELPAPAVELAPVFGLLALPLCFVPYARYLYDPGTLLLWALALALVSERRHVLVWLLLPVLACHKETAVLLPPLVALREWDRAPRARVLGTLVLQLALVGGVRLWIGRLYAANPGGTVLWVGPAHTLELIRMTFRRPPYVLGVVAAFAALVRSGWGATPVFLRRALLVVLLPLVLLALVFGYVDEIRGYYEAWAIVFLLALPGTLSLLGAPPARVRELAP